jgi:hypothetical protein
MKTPKLIALTLISATILFSCQSKPSGANSSEVNTDEPETSTTLTQTGKYAIKSGIVEYKTQMMGMDVKQTLTFDDYGKLDVQEVEMEMMGVKVHTLTLSKDGYMYNIDMVQKTGTKMAGVNNANIDFQNLSEQMVKDMNLRKLGTEEFLGKTCDKMSIDYKAMSMTGTFLVYKGVALMSDTDMGTMKMKLVAEKFIENPDIPVSKFEIPSDVTIKEL